MTTQKSDLAINGGVPVRTEPMPPRFALGPDEEGMISDVLAYYRERQVDPGYQGHFEERYCQGFAGSLGGGYADAVATGTAAVFIAVAALNLPKGSEVLVSPITDPGTLSAITMNGLIPRLVDATPGTFNVGAEQIKQRLTSKTTALVLVHSFGQAVNMDEVMPVIEDAGIKLIEDCSQSHGAKWQGKPVGTFGDIAAFSTMYRKAHITGASGGIVFTKDLELYRFALAHADRGKTPWIEGFDERNPDQFLFSALNLHTDEISCAIGISSLKRLTDIILKRSKFVANVAREISSKSDVCKGHTYMSGDSPFVYPIWVDEDKISCTKKEFAEAVRDEGIGLNPHYEYLVANWGYLKPFCSDDFSTPNARESLDTSFCLYLNENYGPDEAIDVAMAVEKVEKAFLKS